MHIFNLCMEKLEKLICWEGKYNKLQWEQINRLNDDVHGVCD